MKIGMVGLGRMGMNMVRRLIGKGHSVVAYNRSPGKVDEIVKEGATGAYTLEDLVGKLEAPRVVWLMLPAGKPVDDALLTLKELLARGDTVVEGGNSYFGDAPRRAGALLPRGIRFLDAGVSGGIWGLREGYCLMLGGDEQAYRDLLPILQALAPNEDGYLYCGPPGAGHFVKMVHNGIEYGMLAAYGEGFEIMKASPYGGVLDMRKIAHLWNQGSVVRSWLLELAEAAFEKDPQLAGIKGYIEDSGEGRWMVQQAIESSVPVPVIASSLFQRFLSRQDDSFAAKVIAALRQEFGGHAIKKQEG